MNAPVVFLMGPTASGKTDLAAVLVARLPMEIVSVDSAMIYRGMDVGTAKPDAELLARAPHRLIDILDPAQSYSAAQFRADALREIEDIHARGRIPLLVGGTMLYFRALQQGLAEMPSADPAVRAQIETEAAVLGSAGLHKRLAEVDPASAARIHPNDPQRVQRALEVYLLTGVPLSRFIERQEHALLPYPTVELALYLDREVLRERIDVRFRNMLRSGFLEEVERLRSRGDLRTDMPSIRCVGYRQAWAYMDGEYDRETMISEAIRATRQLAKRQLTWLRQWERAVRLDALDTRLEAQALKTLAAASIT